MKEYLKEKQVAFEAVWKASLLAQKMQGKLETLDVVNKEDFSPVTLTDFSVQALINMHLVKAFPDIPIMGEEDSLFLRNPQHESIKKKVVLQLQEFFPNVKEEEILDAIDKGGASGGKEGRFWVLDPIDGTRGFIRNEQYAVALALIDKGKVVLSLLGCPRLKVSKKVGIFAAKKNEGCFFFPLDLSTPYQVHVSSVRHPKEVIYAESPASSRTHSHSKAYDVAKSLNAHPEPFRLDSQCKYAIVAAGLASIYLRIPTTDAKNEKIWDHAPGALIVEEAGGKVTDLQGKKLDFSLGKTLSDNYGIVATNGLLHDAVLKALSQIRNS